MPKSILYRIAPQFQNCHSARIPMRFSFVVVGAALRRPPLIAPTGALCLRSAELRFSKFCGLRQVAQACLFVLTKQGPQAGSQAWALLCATHNFTPAAKFCSRSLLSFLYGHGLSTLRNEGLCTARALLCPWVSCRDRRVPSARLSQFPLNFHLLSGIWDHRLWSSSPRTEIESSWHLGSFPALSPFCLPACSDGGTPEVSANPLAS